MRNKLLLLLFLPSTLFAQQYFQDLAEAAGVRDWGPNYGVAIADYDRDGRDDIYVTRSEGPNRLFRNLGDLRFEDVAPELGVAVEGYSTCAVWGDVDNDGWLDLFVGHQQGADRLFRNNGGSFQEITAWAGVFGADGVRAALFADVDRDGDLDLYVARINLENTLYRNLGNGQFENFTLPSGATDPQISMGAVFFDYDRDQDPDLYLTHDAHQPYILYQNDGTGHFTDVSAQSNTNYAGQGMGVDFGDANNDGWLDLYITNLSDNTLLLNQGDGTFLDVSQSAGITDPGMGWGTTFLDFDNDGRPDIFMVNDSYFSPLPNVLYRNLGSSGGIPQFEPLSGDTLLASMEASYGTACADFNNDGLLDLFVANRNGALGNQLLINQTPGAGNWVKFHLRGKESNRFGIGAQLTLESGTLLCTDELAAGSGYASQNSPLLHFGLGDAPAIDRITVRWPSGQVDTYENLPANTTYTLHEGEGLVTSTLETSLDASLVVYPNPTADRIFLQPSETLTDLRFRLLDAAGRILLQAPPGTQTLDLSRLPAGTYLLEGFADGVLLRKKIVVR